MNKYKVFALLLISAMFLSGYVNRAPDVDHISAILILDNSGSMQTSDPDNLRFSGARMLISLLDAGDSGWDHFVFNRQSASDPWLGND